MPGDSRLDDTLPGTADLPPVDDDAVRATAKFPPVEDRTVVAGPPAGATSVMPPAEDDWAASRAKAAWSGRAEVRAPQYADDWSAAETPREPGGRWYMPIIVGTVILVMLGVLGWAVYLIAQNSDNETPATNTTTSAAPATTATTESTPPSTAPSSMISTVPTTDPAATEVTVPALKGLSQQEAVDALTRKGLAYRVIAIEDQQVPPGTVIDSDPTEGQEVPPDTRITLVVSAARTATPPTTSTTTTTGSTDGPGAD